MTLDLNTLRRSRTTDVSTIIEKFETTGRSGGGQTDDRFWRLDGDKLGNGSAIIRFLPNVETDEYGAPWIPIYEYNFVGPSGLRYSNLSLKTLDKPDPAHEYSSSLWAISKSSGRKEDETIARQYTQQTRFISNILVVSDPARPENDGKVFMFKYGKAIYNKLMALAKPTYDDVKAINAFDLWDGANFKFRMRRKDGRANYDDSSFSDQSQIASTDEAILSIMNQRYNLQDMLKPELFKSYDELKSILDRVLRDPKSSGTAESLSNSIRAPEFKSQPAPTVGASKPSTIDEDDDDVLSYFSKMALDD